MTTSAAESAASSSSFEDASMTPARSTEQLTGKSKTPARLLSQLPQASHHSMAASTGQQPAASSPHPHPTFRAHRTAPSAPIPSKQDCSELICMGLGSDLGRFACVSTATNQITGGTSVWRDTYQVPATAQTRCHCPLLTHARLCCRLGLMTWKTSGVQTPALHRFGEHVY